MFPSIVAIAAIGFVAIVGLQLSSFDIEGSYLLFLPGVIMAVAVGGGVAGVIAIFFASVLTWFFFIPPLWSFAVPSIRGGVTLLLYVAVSILFCRIYYSQRRTIDELASSNVSLQAKLVRIGKGKN
jgi:K+-sensing histidine kinase KdpD